MPRATPRARPRTRRSCKGTCAAALRAPDVPLLAGHAQDGRQPALDSAPAFLAQLAVEDRSYLEALTATSGTCPGFDPQTGTFTAASCNNTPQSVGLLTHPGVQAHFFSNLGFRRVRWVQETFACGAFPAEIAHSAASRAGGLLATSAPADLAAYGIDGTTRADVAALGRALIVTAKAFAMNLTSSVIVPGPRDDPHEAFANLAATTAVAGSLKRVLDGFMPHLSGLTDGATGRPLSEELVLTIDGDTPKTPLSRQNWLDDTPESSNWMFVLGGGELKTGWFGEVTRTGAVTGFDPATGASRGYQGDAQAEAACTAVAYAIARGDLRRVQDFSRVDISGLVVP